MSDFIFKIDRFVAKLFHSFYLWGGEVSNNLMKWISLIAEAGILFLLVGFGLALFKRTRKVGLVVLLSVAIGFLLTNVLLKNIIERARPFGNVSSEFYKWWLDAGATNESGYSFPSGHTTATTAFAIAIFLTTRKKYSWPILFLPLLMASSRIYLMVHYFSDCVGGIMVGTIAAVIAWIIAKWIYRSKIKLFVWARELNIFKSKSTAVASNNTATSEQPAKETVEDIVYIPQQDEQSSTQNESIIKQKINEIAEKEENDK